VYPEVLVLPYLQALHSEIAGVENLLAELKISPALLRDAQVNTIYFGGGTPSMIDGRHIGDLMELLESVFELSAALEVTLEVNPGSVDSAKVQLHRDSGVNRISIGMQTFQDRLLERIGRSHTVADSLSTVSLYRESGLDNVSLDLIAGLPGQTPSDWQQNLEAVEMLAPEHISLYMLEIHENTHFGKMYGKTGSARFEGVPPIEIDELPGDDEVATYYMQAVQRFAGLGYRQYEISNFATPGRESQHNLKYWTDQPFIGFGCGAYSYLDGKRWGNERSAGRYTEMMHSRQHAIGYRSHLSPADRQEEAIFLGLRLTEGIWLQGFEQRFGIDLRHRYQQQISHLREAGLIEFTPEQLRLTPQGWMLSNEVFTEFLR
jgi:oxygen-independent coproporphyrinogen-3 oxidase